MKKKMATILTLICALALSTTASATAHIDEPVGDPYQEPVKIRLTCYLDRGTTAAGTTTRQGIVATCKEWMQPGDVIEIWTVEKDENGNDKLGEFCGYFEPQDTGAGIDTTGDGKGNSIKDGLSIDVWCEDEEALRSWQAGGDYYYIRITHGKG